MNNTRKSPVWRISSEEFKTYFDASHSVKDLIDRIVGCEPRSTTLFYKEVKKRAKEEGLDLDILKVKMYGKPKKMTDKTRHALTEIFTERSSYSNRKQIKKYLLELGIVSYVCAICSLGNEWQSKPLVLILDHINGIPDDNRMENLRLLCPNCNSQTETFSGRNSKTKVELHANLIANGKTELADELLSYCSKTEVKYQCVQCGGEITYASSSGLCSPCWARKSRKVERPTKEELAEMIATLSWRAIGKMFGVSDNAIRKWARGYGLLPDRP